MKRKIAQIFCLAIMVLFLVSTSDSFHTKDPQKNSHGNITRQAMDLKQQVHNEDGDGENFARWKGQSLGPILIGNRAEDATEIFAGIPYFNPESPNGNGQFWEHFDQDGKGLWGNSPASKRAQNYMTKIKELLSGIPRN